MLSSIALESALMDLLEHRMVYLERLEDALQVAARIESFGVQLVSLRSGFWKLTVQPAAGPGDEDHHE